MYPQQPYPQQAPQTYAPPMPQYPAQPAYAPQGYPAPQYAQPPAPAGPPPPPGSLDTFYQQPSSGGGPSFKFMDSTTRQPQVGKSYAGFVARPVTDADVRAQTTEGGQVQTFKDGRPKFVMVVPMQVQPSQEFPEGIAGWWVKGQARDELARAMAEAGAPAGPPEAGAFIRVTLAGIRPIPGRNPAYQYRVEYVRPGGVPAVGGPVEQYDNPSAPTAQPMPNPHAVPNAQWQPAPAAPAQYVAPLVQQAPAPAQVAPQPVPVQQPANPPAATTGFTEEQAALFARLTGGQQS